MGTAGRRIDGSTSLGIVVIASVAVLAAFVVSTVLPICWRGGWIEDHDDEEDPPLGAAFINPMASVDIEDDDAGDDDVEEPILMEKQLSVGRSVSRSAERDASSSG